MKSLSELKKQAKESYNETLKNDPDTQWDYFWLGWLEGTYRMMYADKQVDEEMKQAKTHINSTATIFNEISKHFQI